MPCAKKTKEERDKLEKRGKKGWRRKAERGGSIDELQAAVKENSQMKVTVIKEP